MADNWAVLVRSAPWESDGAGAWAGGRALIGWWSGVRSPFSHSFSFLLFLLEPVSPVLRKRNEEKNTARKYHVNFDFMVLWTRLVQIRTLVYSDFHNFKNNPKTAISVYIFLHFIHMFKYPGFISVISFIFFPNFYTWSSRKYGILLRKLFIPESVFLTYTYFYKKNVSNEDKQQRSPQFQCVLGH